MTHCDTKEIIEVKVKTAHHDYVTCDKACNSDILFKKYQEQRTLIADLLAKFPDSLIKDIWSTKGLLAIDNYCKCQLGTQEIRAEYTCSSCKNLRRVLDLRNTVVGNKCQILKGPQFKIEAIPVDNPFMYRNIEAANRARQFVKQFPALHNCGTPNIEQMQCIVSDTFTNNILVSYFLEQQMRLANLHHNLILFNSFICHNIGYNLSEIPSIGSLSDLHKEESFHNVPIHLKAKTTGQYDFTALRPEISKTIILQLLVMLHFLTKFNFSHGAPGINALVFSKEPLSYNYQGTLVKGPLTVKLTNFQNSSFTINNFHYYAEDLQLKYQLHNSVFLPEISNMKIKMAYCNNSESNKFPAETGNDLRSSKFPAETGNDLRSSKSINGKNYDVCDDKDNEVTLFRLTSNTLEIYRAIRQIGFPLYVGAFDFYCFMISLMCDKSFFESVKNDVTLNRLWSLMWLIEDIEAIETKIKSFHENENLQSETVKILRGAWLRCDIVNYLLKNFQ